MVLLLENVGQMVEQRNDGRHRRLAQAVIHVFQEILSIFIALIRCQLEPLDRTGSIFWDLLPKQIELAEGILGVLIALFRCGGEPADGGFHILWLPLPPGAAACPAGTAQTDYPGLLTASADLVLLRCLWVHLLL